MKRPVRPSQVLDAHAGGRADYVMIDVEGFDAEVLISLDLAKHRPRLVNFESKILQGKRPDALWKAAAFCMARGYFVVGPLRANHVCVRVDAPPRPRPPLPGQPPLPEDDLFSFHVTYYPSGLEPSGAKPITIVSSPRAPDRWEEDGPPVTFITEHMSGR